ncbi:hypothetical protein [Nostoc flagelliforme]|nr:hypothetical protein [Nostoc flagelliforme]
MERTAIFAPSHFVHLPIRAFGKEISLITDRYLYYNKRSPNPCTP